MDNTGTDVIAAANLYWWLTEQGLAHGGAAENRLSVSPVGKGQRIHAALLLDEGVHEGYFWYNCETGNVTGLLELK